MSKQKTLPRIVDPETPANELKNLPKDAVALLVWRGFTGSQPLTIVVTKESWLINEEAVVNNGFAFDPGRAYKFVSPVSPEGRQTTFLFQDVVGWAANVDNG